MYCDKCLSSQLIENDKADLIQNAIDFDKIECYKCKECVLCSCRLYKVQFDYNISESPTCLKCLMEDHLSL